MCPQSREDVIVQQMPDELLVYDRGCHRAHALDRVSAYVWRQCDGRTSVQEIAARLPDALDVPANEDLVLLALDSLRNAHLLMQPGETAPPEPRCSRRELAKRLGKVAIAVPVVMSVLAPTAAQASSGSRGGNNRSSGNNGKNGKNGNNGKNGK